MSVQQHNSEDVKQFFNQWHLYQQIMENNYIAHHGIHAALRKFVVSQFDKPFTLLDLGCGDASAIPSTFAGTTLQAYTGVDLSPVVLQQAAKNLMAVPFEIDLVEDDFTRYLAHSGWKHFDVVLAGFALHHLYLEEKRQFFKQCYAILEPSGYFLLYDVFRRPSETREEYIQAYSRNCRERWTQLSYEKLADVIEHINECDFPETYETIATVASEAGFTSKPTPLSADALRFHCLYNFQRNSCRE